MGRSFSTSSGKNVVFGSLDATVQLRTSRDAALNGFIQGEVVKSASLNAFTSLFTQYELGAALDAYLVPNTTLINGLVSYWKLDGDSTDAVGSNHGTDTAITYSVGNGKLVQGAGGNGSTSKINVGSANLNLLDVSISAWVKPATDNYALWVNRLVGNGAAQSTYEFRMVPGRTVGIGGPGGTGVYSTVPLTLGVWAHVVVTRAATGVSRVYINGTLCGSGTGPVPTSLPSQPTLIGTRDDNYNFLNHPIDEIGMWNRVLTDAEVSELYNRSVGIAYPFAIRLPETSGIISYWKLDGDSTDSLGIGNGTDTAVTYSGANGKINSGGGFNGSSSKVVLPQLAAYKPATFTIAAWVKTTTSGYQEVFESYNQSGTPAGFEFRQNGSGIELVLGNGSSFTVTSSSRAINSGNWTHVAATYDGATVRIYVNGFPDTVGANATGVAYTGDTRVRIGVNNYTGATELYWFNGSIDEVGFWDRPFTALEIDALYNKGVGQQYPFGTVAPITAGLLGYWKLDFNSADSLGLAHGTDTDIIYNAGNGKVVQGAGFNGTTSRIDAGSSLPLDSNNWSLAVWVNPTTTTSRFLTYYGNGPTLQWSGGNVSLVHGATLDWNPGIPVTAGVWTHLVMTRRFNLISVYKNGALLATNSAFSASFTKDTTVRFGNSPFTSEPLTGALDEIGIWNRALDAGEAAALYNLGSGIQYPF